MSKGELYENAVSDMMVRQALCSVTLMHEINEICKMQGLEVPFNIEKDGEFRVAKRLYREMYRLRYVTANEVDNAVKRALELYAEGIRP